MRDTVYKLGIPAAIGLFVGIAIGMSIASTWCPDVCPVKDDADLAVLGTSTKVGTATTTTTEKDPLLTLVFNTIMDNRARVEVSDQAAGAMVTIARVEVSLPTWVAIREVVGGTVGNILGAQLVNKSSDVVTVNLLRETDAGNRYQVYLYQDDGDSIFDFERDLLITQKQQAVTAGFTAQ